MNSDSNADKILILDFGSQYTQLIARRVRESGCYCEVFSCDVAEDKIKLFAPKGIILSGGPESTSALDAPEPTELIYNMHTPVLGICYGMQIMAQQLGGSVASSSKREFGHARVKIGNTASIFKNIQSNAEFNVWMSHGDKVDRLPEGFEAIAQSDNSPIAAMENTQKKLYGFQFHPEVTHTDNGQQIIDHFVHEICDCGSAWNPENIIKSKVAEIKKIVGDDQVVLALSGGVDSSVAACLLSKAIGSKLTCVFVNNGLLRLNESEQVMETFDKHFKIKVLCVDAQDRFLNKLSGVQDPEDKRKAIGNLFIDIFQEESVKLKNVKWLAQGTIYPDVIESAAAKTNKAHLIKSHHNVGGLPEKMNLSLIEPLRDLFKDEVRQIGVALGLSKEIVFRHPFPGPGLGVRILGEVKKEYADLLREADNIFIEELRANNLYDKVAQAFVVFMPVKTVGVMGDGRRYEYVVSLRAVETTDFMTAQWAKLPYDFLEKVSTRIINEVDGIARVTYDISTKPPATIEWE